MFATVCTNAPLWACVKRVLNEDGSNHECDTIGGANIVYQRSTLKDGCSKASATASPTASTSATATASPLPTAGGPSLVRPLILVAPWRCDVGAFAAGLCVVQCRVLDQWRCGDAGWARR